MSGDEYIPDPPLAADAAAALIKSCFPTIDAAGLRYLGSGTQFDAFATKDGWAFRFPRWDWVGQLFESEARAHSLVAQILPSQIRIPRVEHLAPPTPKFPRPFAGHRLIPGVAADTVDGELLPTLAREIAVLLTAVHSTPAPVAGAAGIHEIGIDSPGRREWLEHGVAVASKLRGLDPIVDHGIAWLNTISLTPPSGGTLQLIHGGLEPEHVLVNPETGFVVGVIDWTDTQLGDAARDFVFLVTWRGWRFAEEVLRAYPRAVDPEFRARLRYMAQLLSLMGLAFAHEQGAELTKHVRAVRNAFATSDVSSPRISAV
jgi:aminoglycoside phosphotransferase (APT) family kinase protein